MANRKARRSAGKNKPPTHSRVVNGKVILSDERNSTLSKIKDLKARAQLKAQWESEVMEAFEKRQAFLAERDVYEIEITEAGLLRVKGTGGRWAHFTREGIERLLADLDNVRALVATMQYRDGTPSTDDAEPEATETEPEAEPVKAPVKKK